MGLWTRRLAELGGMMAIGDGFLAAVDPKGHVRLWERGPWRNLMKPFANYPGLTRAVGVAEIVAGVWLSRAAIEGGEKPTN